MSSPVYLATVNAVGPIADLPAYGIPGRRFFALDTLHEYYDTGAAWLDISSQGGSMGQQVNGSISGSAWFSQPELGPNYKKVVIVLNNLDGTASFTFPMYFTFVPDYHIGATASGALITALSTTAVTVQGAPSNGTIILEGF